MMQLIAKYDKEKDYDKLEELLWKYKRHYDNLAEFFRKMGKDLEDSCCQIDNVPVRITSFILIVALI